LLATSSHPTRHGELTKEKIGRMICLLAMASEVTWEASKGGLTSQDDVAQTQWGRNLCSPWRTKELARRVDADGKAYK